MSLSLNDHYSQLNLSLKIFNAYITICVFTQVILHILFNNYNIKVYCT